MMSNTRPVSHDDGLYRFNTSLKQRLVGCSKWCSQDASQQGKNVLDLSISYNSSTGVDMIPSDV